MPRVQVTATVEVAEGTPLAALEVPPIPSVRYKPRFGKAEQKHHSSPRRLRTDRAR